MNKMILVAGCAVAALSIAACNRESGGAADQQNQAANTVQDATAGAVGAAAAPVGAATNETFVMNAAIGDMYVIQAGQIGRGAAEKALGQKMIADHTKSSGELKPIAQALNIQVPTELDERRRGMIDNLRGATDQDFDRVYLQQQEAAHNEMSLLLEGYSRMGDNAELKGWATRTLPVVQQHKTQVDGMDENNADNASH
jgi:putative membrane protein